MTHQDNAVLMKLAGRDEPLVAEWSVVQCFSCCARSMPDPEPEADRLWDLSMLLIDGLAVSQNTVLDWLNLAYNQTYAASYNPEAFQSLIAAPLLADRLYQLLAFADAVGSPKGLVSIFGPDHMKSLVLPVQLGQQVIEINLGGDHVYGATDLQLSYYKSSSQSPTYIGQPALNKEEIAAFKQSTYAKLEGLFLLSFKLNVKALQVQLYRFLRSQEIRTNSLFCPSLLFCRSNDMNSMVFTERVAMAAIQNEKTRLMWAAALIECPEQTFTRLSRG